MTVTWDFESIEEYFINKLKIPKEKLQFWLLGSGEPGVCTRSCRKTYTIGKYSKSLRTQKQTKKRTTVWVRPLVVDMALSFSYAIKEIKKILKQIEHFNHVDIMYKPGHNTVGAYVSAGGEYKN